MSRSASEPPRWAVPLRPVRSPRFLERPARHRELVWLPRYRIELGVRATGGEEAVWEVWLCGLDGSLCSGRPEVRRGRAAARPSGEPPSSPLALVVEPLLGQGEAVERARELLARSAHVLRLQAGTSPDPVRAESWRHPAHLEIYRRFGRWAVRAFDGESERRVSRSQLHALLEALVAAERAPNDR